MAEINEIQVGQDVFNIGGSGGGVNYSTQEQNTGLKWVDGKTLYQKVIIKNNWQVANDASFAHQISNVDMIFIKEGFFVDGNNYVQLPLIWSTSYNGFYVNATDVVCKGTGTWGVTANRSLYLVLRYTKTTDTPS